jgi:subtilisin family serine protease
MRCSSVRAVVVGVALSALSGLCASLATAQGKNEEPLFASSHVLVRVTGGYEAGRNADGDWTFARSAQQSDLPHQAGAAAGQAPAELDALVRVLRGVGVSNIVRPLPYTPVHADAAAAVGLDRWWRIDIPEGSNALAVADLLKATWTGFEVSEVDGIGGVASVPNDPGFSQQYALRNTGQSGGTVGADIRATEAWDIVTGNPNIIIAVLDSGAFPHTELSGRILPGRNVPLNNTDTSEVCGGHGTHVSGIIAASGNNQVGIAGICWTARILPVVVVNPCSGLESQVADGLVWAVDHDADLVNMSLQYSVGSQYLLTAVQYAAALDIPMFAAVGNSSSAVAFPARFSETIAVAGSTRFDQRYSLSNFGPEVDLSAPAESVYSLSTNNSYANRSGTSMSCAHVTGTAALMRAVFPRMKGALIRTVLMQQARDIDAVGFDELTGAGVVNAAASVAAAAALYPGPADLDGDAMVGGTDLTILLSQWGNCDGCNCVADINADCSVNGTDLTALLSAWSGS